MEKKNRILITPFYVVGSNGTCYTKDSFKEEVNGLRVPVSVCAPNGELVVEIESIIGEAILYVEEEGLYADVTLINGATALKGNLVSGSTGMPSCNSCKVETVICLYAVDSYDHSFLRKEGAPIVSCDYMLTKTSMEHNKKIQKINRIKNHLSMCVLRMNRREACVPFKDKEALPGELSPMSIEEFKERENEIKFKLTQPRPALVVKLKGITSEIGKTIPRQGEANCISFKEKQKPRFSVGVKPKREAPLSVVKPQPKRETPLSVVKPEPITDSDLERLKENFLVYFAKETKIPKSRFDDFDKELSDEITQTGQELLSKALDAVGVYAENADVVKKNTIEKD